MKVTSNLLMSNVEFPVQIGGLKLTVIHQLCIYKGKHGEASWEAEIIDHSDITYMGVPIESNYTNWKKFTNFHKEMGIDFDKLIREEANKVFDDKAISLLVAEMLPDTLEHLIS